jgi:uncharacterized membrane protein
VSYLRPLLAATVRYSLYAFVVFSLVVSLLSGFADVVTRARCVSAQREWVLEAEAEGEAFSEVNYTPNLITGISAFLMFGVTSVLAVRFFRKRFDCGTHILVIAVTALAALIFFLPRPPVGTGTERMKEVFAYLMLLGIINSSLYRTFFPDDGSAGSSS